jgi:hypothetical protein
VARAAPILTDLIRADGCGLRRVAPHSMPSIHKSLPKANWPVTFSIPSGLGALSPIRSAGDGEICAGAVPRGRVLPGGLVII